MYNYDLICECGYTIVDPKDSDYRFEDGERRFPYCPVCGGIMSNGVSGLASKGDYYHVSESLGIIPEQTEEHRKHWPTVDVLPDGKLGFHSVRDQERYANHFNMDKKSQKVRR